MYVSRGVLFEQPQRVIASQNGRNVFSSVLLRLLHAFQSREFNRIEAPYDYRYHLYQMKAYDFRISVEDLQIHSLLIAWILTETEVKILCTIMDKLCWKMPQT